MRIGTLCIECGALFLFASSRTARAFLLLFTLLLGVFFLTLGYFFWKWMVLQLALWVLLFRGSDPARAAWRRDLFTRQRFAMSLIVIGGAGDGGSSPAALAWFDTPLANTIRYEAIGRSGGVYDLSPGFFAPYESHVAMGAFVVRLTPAPILATAYGVTGRQVRCGCACSARTRRRTSSAWKTPRPTGSTRGRCSVRDGVRRVRPAHGLGRQPPVRRTASHRRTARPSPSPAVPLDLFREDAVPAPGTDRLVRVYRVSSLRWPDVRAVSPRTAENGHGLPS